MDQGGLIDLAFKLQKKIYKSHVKCVIIHV